MENKIFKYLEKTQYGYLVIKTPCGNEIDIGDKKWILFWNFGENKFIHIPEENIERNRELKLLKEISDKTIFFSDNYINEDSKYAIPNPKNFNHILTNDVFMW